MSQIYLSSVSGQSQVSLRLVSGWSQVSLKYLCAYFVRQTDPKYFVLLAQIVNVDKYHLTLQEKNPLNNLSNPLHRVLLWEMESW